MTKNIKKKELGLEEVADFVADYRNAIKVIQTYGSKMGEFIGKLDLKNTDLSLDLIVEFLALEKHRVDMSKRTASQLKVLSRLLDTTLIEKGKDPDLIEMR